MSIAGIDLGTGRVKASRLDTTGNSQIVEFNGDNFLQSAIYFAPEGEVILGAEAENLMLCEPDRGVLHWKRYIGSDDVLHRTDDGKEYRAVDCARIYLEQVKAAYEKATGEILRKAVLSVPANYNDRQKTETRQAAEAVGIEVLKLAHEPTAALIGNEVHKRGDGWYVVIDIGHGTTDVSVARCEGNSVDIKTTSGIPRCGGMDFTQRLIDYVNEEFRRRNGFALDPKKHAIAYQELYQRCVQAKHALAGREKTSLAASADGKVLSLVITREKFASLTEDLVSDVCNCVDTALKDAGLTAADIKEFVPVGGGSMVPSLADEIENRLGKKPTTHTDVHFAVARGAVIMARLEEEAVGNSVEVDGRKLPPLNLSARDVTAHPIGVAVVDNEKVRHMNSVILQKGIPIPSTKMCPFALAEPGQTDALIEILQGPDGAPKDECLLLGHFELRDLQPVHDRPHKIEIKLSINKDGVLTAVAYDPLDGTTADLELEYKKDEEPVGV